MTVNQLALVVGVATFGTLYLNLAGRLPQDAAGGFRPVSAHAAAVTCAVLAVGAVAGCILTVLRARGTRQPGLAADVGAASPTWTAAQPLRAKAA